MKSEPEAGDGSMARGDSCYRISETGRYLTQQHLYRWPENQENETRKEGG